MTTSDPCREITELLARLGRAVDGDGFSAGLNPAQWSALRYLARANRFSRSTSGFAAYHGTTRGTASQTIKALIDKGLVRREPDPMDGRRVMLHLTPAARDVLERDPSQRLALAARSMPAPEQVSVLRGLRAIWQMSDAAADSSFGECALCQHLSPCREGSGNDYYCEKKRSKLQSHELQSICVNFDINDLTADSAAR